MPKIVGGCLCGAVRYKSDADPVVTGVCHCRHCQRQTGTSFSVLVAVPKGSLRFEGQALAAFNDVGESGQPVIRRFCPKCGSPIFSDVAVTPTLDWIKAGTLDDVSWLKPQMNIWCETAQPWVSMSEGVPQFPRNPPG